ADTEISTAVAAQGRFARSLRFSVNLLQLYLPNSASIGSNPEEIPIGWHVQVCRFHLRQPRAQECPGGASIRSPIDAYPGGGIDGVAGCVAWVNNDPIDRQVGQAVLSR